MDLNDTETAIEAVAEETLSPSVTEGTSSSDVTDEAEKDSAEAIREDFLKKWGEEESAETDEAGEPELAAEGDADGAETAEDQPDEAETEQNPTEEEPALAETDDGEDDEFRIPDEEFKALSGGVKKRLGHLNARAKKAERELSQHAETIKPLEEKSSRFDELQSFVQTNSIQPENVTVAFDAMAKMSAGDYQGFLDLVQPWYQQAQLAVGAAIAPDLQQRVDDGYLTEDDAKELTQARVSAEVNKNRVADLTEKQQQQAESQAAEDNRSSVLQAFNSREAHFKSSDPDYALKSQAIASMIEFAVKGGNIPDTPEKAIEMVNDAHERVTASLAPPKPKPQQTPPRVSATNPAISQSAPKNTHDAIFQKLSGT